MKNKRPEIKKKKVTLQTTAGVAHISSSFNNTIVSISAVGGGVIAASSAGALGYKGSRKSTPLVAGEVATEACNKAYEQGIRTLDIRVKGIGPGRDTAIRSLQSMSDRITVKKLTDVTPLPHNGCRPPKRPRK